MNNSVESSLNTIKSGSIRFRKKANLLLSDFRYLTNAFLEMNQEDRANFLDCLDDETAKKLISLSCRAAERAINTRDPNWIDAGALAYVMEGFRSDYRENYRQLIFLDHAARVLNIDLKMVFERYREISSQHAWNRLAGFLSRSPEQNNLKVFGLAEKETSEGIIITSS